MDGWMCLALLLASVTYSTRFDPFSVCLSATRVSGEKTKELLQHLFLLHHRPRIWLGREKKLHENIRSCFTARLLARRGRKNRDF